MLSMISVVFRPRDHDIETNPDPKLLASLAVTMHDLGQKQRARPF